MATRNPARTSAQKKAAAVRPAKRSTKNNAPPENDLAHLVHNMELSYLQCRDFGHSWRPYTARWLPKDNCYESQLECARCKTVRTRFLSRTGEQIGGRYDYVDGYQINGMGRLTGSDRDVIRLESILAVLPQDTVDE